MAILLIRQDGKTSQWLNAFKSQASQIECFDYNEPHPKETITMALVWKQPHGLFEQYKNLKCVASMGAGVDFIFEDPSFHQELLMTRVVDPLLITDMEEFVTAQVYAYMKGLYQYHSQQSFSLWQQNPYLRKKDITIGIMGMGVLGSATAKALSDQGFNVLGWSNSKKQIEGITTYEKVDLDLFLEKTNVLVCLLPLTPDTNGILNESLFSKLPRGAYLIHVARGPHLVGEDLIQSIDKGQMCGAAIDVFPTEPLDTKSPFWGHSKIHITPHCASISSPESVVAQIVVNYNRLTSHQPLLNQVDTLKGY
jgi:glyoxylate/hydroxypyruvate reductase A